MIPQRPDPERVRRLNALADLHDQWVQDNADSAGFKPDGHRGRKSDYNLHNVDLDADGDALDDFHTQAEKIFQGGGEAE